MTEQEKQQVYQIISEHPEGIKARDIANLMSANITKHDVNVYLYSFRQESPFYKDPLDQWHIRQSVSDLDTVLKKRQNKVNAKNYTKEYFLSLADWSVGGVDEPDRHLYTTRTGNIIYCDSVAETKVLAYLEENELVNDLGGQALAIKYDSEFQADLTYHPDIVALTKDNHILIIEVKSVMAMDNHRNLRKYNRLEEYCKENKYEYLMIDPYYHYISFEEFCNTACVDNLEKMFKEMDAQAEENPLKPYIYFDKTDVEQWYELYGDGITSGKFKIMVHSLIVKYGWYNVFRHGFKVYNRPVCLDEDHNVTRWI